MAPWVLYGLCTAVGAVLGALIAGLNARTRAAEAAAARRQAVELQAQAADLQGRVTDLTGELRAREAEAARIPALETRERELSDSLAARGEKIARLETAIEEERRVLAESRRQLEESRGQLTDTFRALASDALKHNNQSFLELATQNFGRAQETAKGDMEQRHQALDAMVKPLREQLARYEQQIAALENSRQEAYGRLAEQLTALSDRTGKLSLALRAPQARGRWGEVQLKRVAELAGMVEHCDFDLQVSADTDDGRVRPDMTVNLPGGGMFIVDAKTSLAAYMDAVEQVDAGERLAHLKRHADQVETHMKQLGNKEYWVHFKQTPDFVIMFLPGDNFLSAALEQRPDLMEKGFEKKVLLVSPATLVALLRTAAMAWRQERIAEHAGTICAMAKDLYERLATMGDHLSRVGDHLGKSVHAYNKAVGSLESRVLTTARKFPQLGVAPRKTLDEIAQLEIIPVALSAPEFGTGNNAGES